MESLNSILQRQTGSQASERTREPDNLSERLAQIQAEVQRRQKIIEQAPATKKVIQHPRDCPWSDDPYKSCKDCQSGNRIESVFEPEPHKFIYDVGSCYAEVQYQELIKKCGLIGIELQHTFDNAVIDGYNRSLYNMLQKWNPEHGGGIYIAAKKDSNNPQGNGTGKSYALHALAHRLCRMGVRCLYARTVDFLMELKAAYDDGSRDSESRVLRKYTQVPVLMLDDIGKENARSDWAPERFYYLIDYRVRANKPMIISSNFNIGELEKKFGDNFGPAIASRLAGFCELHYLGGPDRRWQGRN